MNKSKEKLKYSPLFLTKASTILRTPNTAKDGLSGNRNPTRFERRAACRASPVSH